MTARRAPAAHLCLRVGSRHEVAFVPFPAKAPMFVIGAGSTLVSLHPARAPGRRARGLRPPARGQGVGLRGGGRTPVPGPAPAARRAGPVHADRATLRRCSMPSPERAGPGAAARRAGGDGMTTTSCSPVQRGRHGQGPVLRPADRQHLHPLLHLRRRRADPDHPGRPGGHHDHQPRPGRGDRGGRAVRPPAGRGRDPVRGRAGKARRQGPRGGGRSWESAGRAA